MVVFTSGIVDGLSLVSSLWLGVGEGLLMALRWWGMGSSTLLGPEGSAVCWLVVLVLPLLEAVLCGWLRVLVGLLFEICIVDASIFAAGWALWGRGWL